MASNSNSRRQKRLQSLRLRSTLLPSNPKTIIRLRIEAIKSYIREAANSKATLQQLILHEEFNVSHIFVLFLNIH
jgi:predicted ATPase